jgi:hypothetical protein
VMVRGFFFGALPFSGDESLELAWLLGISTSCQRSLVRPTLPTRAYESLPRLVASSSPPSSP